LSLEPFDGLIRKLELSYFLFPDIFSSSVFWNRRLFMIETIRFKLNGRPVRLKVDGERTLLWVLRTDLGITGPKYGCGEGLCGACTVLADDVAVLSCQKTIKDVTGSAITTIEGLAQNGRLHPLQKAFIEHVGFQCGYCTPGMILKANAAIVHPE
jgi:aerobic-type carbon monoxide dehydrogenase small subunit (CoxS/CutS family)